MDYEKAAMQRRIDNLMERLELVKRQRDAAVKDLKDVCTLCCVCCHCKSNEADYDDVPNVCMDCSHSCNWEWRGLCKQNGGKNGKETQSDR